VLSDGLDGIEPTFSYTGIFLVRKLFLEGFNGSVKMIVSRGSKGLSWGLISRP